MRVLPLPAAQAGAPSGGAAAVATGSAYGYHIDTAGSSTTVLQTYRDVERPGPNYRCNNCGRIGEHLRRDCPGREIVEREDAEAKAARSVPSIQSGVSGVYIAPFTRDAESLFQPRTTMFQQRAAAALGLASGGGAVGSRSSDGKRMITRTQLAAMSPDEQMTVARDKGVAIVD